ncbi:uncharacterized protein LOC117745276 isoform X3 [Cyclopterus lumpus]|uniref:uncharacterized protein LOC117745276 isoform X3 n=1 Tax=Cyclopterus lumpus TaxID=8103 RepID=UPI001486A7C8|nr:uncharacterized protein LOC117745276 isoform X3 [Cyclopterus lumpus]
MSVTFSSKSRVVQEATVNLMASDNRSKYGWRPQLSVWWIGAAAACLGFLLLILILGVVAHNSKAIGHRDSKCENRISSLTADRDALKDERYQLKLDSINLTKEMKVLETRYNTMVVSRDTLQEEVNRFNLSKKDSKAIGHQDSKCENRISSLTADRDALRDERYQLKLDSINLTKEMEVLQTQ